MSKEQAPNPAEQSVGARIRAARLAKKYTQSQLALPDFSVSYISAIERGQIHPSLRALEILARRLELSSTHLLMEHAPGENGNSSFRGGPTNEEATIELELIEVRVSILQGAALEAIARLENLSTKNLQQRYQIQQRYLLGKAYLRTAQLQKCEDALVEAEKLANAQNDIYSSIRIYNILGIVYSAMHNPLRALQSHQTCLKLLESAQPQDSFFLCHVYSQLGQHYTHLNDFASAIDMFKQAIGIAEELAVLEHTKSVYWHISQYYANAADYYLATLYAHKCLYLYGQEMHLPLKSEIYHYLGRAMMHGDQEKARAYLEEALQNNRQDPLTSSSITTHLAAWFLAANAPQEAMKYVKRAFELAGPFGDTIIGVEALLTWGRIQYAQAKYKEGDKHFAAGLDMLERLGNYEELADQSAFYAQLLDERHKAQEAITYYKRAFESRRRIGRYS